MDNLTSYQLAAHLTEATGVKWTTPISMRANNGEAEANCTDFKGYLTVIVRPNREGNGTVISWRFGLSIDHPEGCRTSNHRDEPYIYISAGGTADTIEAAAEAVMSYVPESREMCGRTWWRSASGFGGTPDDWVTPVMGQEVTLTPDRDGGWTYKRGMPELEAVAGMIATSFGTATGALAGKASGLEEAAALAMTAPERLRIAMRGFLALDGGAEDRYSEGVKDGRAAFFAEIASIYRPSVNIPEEKAQ